MDKASDVAGHSNRALATSQVLPRASQLSANKKNKSALKMNKIVNQRAREDSNPRQFITLAN